MKSGLMHTPTTRPPVWQALVEPRLPGARLLRGR
jgi:hypothetical protein